jgi:PPOX class probable FMN-dependent enzyme
MKYLSTLNDLEALYDDAVPAALTKVAPAMTPLYRKWIAMSRFCVLSTAGPDGTDGSPRGDIEPVVRELDESTLLMPDWRGNNRIDTLRNIIEDGRISLMFMLPGSRNVVRINGTARITADPDILTTFEQNKRNPRSVIVIKIGEIYFQCAKAIMRSELWKPVAEAPDVPTAGDLIKERDALFDGAGYDAGYPEYAKSRMW